MQLAFDVLDNLVRDQLNKSTRRPLTSVEAGLLVPFFEGFRPESSGVRMSKVDPAVECLRPNLGFQRLARFVLYEQALSFGFHVVRVLALRIRIIQSRINDWNEPISIEALSD